MHVVRAQQQCPSLAYNSAPRPPSTSTPASCAPNAGFNSTYHVTDLPSFVSGDHMVLFDPHAAYLPGASPASPGLKIMFT
jgi:hypothetical protein